jgi:hypothetical protein
MENLIKNIIKEELENTNKLNEDVYEDFFYFLEDDPKLNTFAYVYYVSNLNRYLAKAKSNPMLDRFIKISKYQFRFGDTYKNAVLRKNPDYEFQQRKGEYTKVQGFSVLEFDRNGDEVLPIMPLKSDSIILVLNEDKTKIIDKIKTRDIQTKYSEYFIGSFFKEKQETASGVEFRALKVKNIIKINAGGNNWFNKFLDFSNIGIDIKNIEIK